MKNATAESAGKSDGADITLMKSEPGLEGATTRGGGAQAPVLENALDAGPPGLFREGDWVRALLKFALEQKASDVHLRVGLRPMIRVFGDIRSINLPIIENSSKIQVMMQNLLGQEAFSRFESGRQSVFMVELEPARFAVQLFRAQGQLAASIRVLLMRILTLDELNFPDVFRDIAAEIFRGLILINGNVGSGRSTAVAALRHEILGAHLSHVVSLNSDDSFPTQTSLKGMHTSMLVGPGFDVDTFDEALECAYRMDPDYIFVMPCLDTLPASAVRQILEMARLGHCVVAGVNADSTGDMLRLMVKALDYREREFALQDLAAVLRVSICQRLLRTADGQGRVACHEILPMMPDIKPAIANLDLDKIGRVLASHEAATSMKRAAKALYQNGKISAAEFERV